MCGGPLGREAWAQAGLIASQTGLWGLRARGVIVKEGASAGVPMVGARGEEVKWGTRGPGQLATMKG